MADTFPEITVELKAYKSHPRNYNRHPASQIERLRASLRKFGQPRNIVVWRRYFVAGHGVAQAAMAEGWATLRANEIPADWPETRVMAFLAADNELSRLSDPDQAALAALIDEARQFDGELLAAIGYDDREFAELLKEVGNATTTTNGDAPPQLDRADELRKLWQVEPGQLWRIGEHRLACGDCTDAATVARAMGGEKADCITTDPPYGVDYDGGTKVREKLSGDGTADLYLPALLAWKPNCNSHVALYLWYADGDQVIAQAVAQAVAQAGWQVRRNLIWNKNQAQYGALSQQYKQKHEPFLYCHLKGKSPYWAGDGTEVTVWDVDRHSVNEFHPTQKPPALFERAIRNSSRAGDIVFDGFAGSGTTLVACQHLQRKARAIELSPAYCSVILQRMRDAFPGIEIERLNG